MFLNDQITNHLGVNHLPFNAVTSEKEYICRLISWGKKVSRTYLTFNDFVHVCQGKKNYMIRGLGKKINYPYPPPPPPSQKLNGWPLMSATVK